MRDITELAARKQAAARKAAIKHGWRAAARIRAAWTEWYYRHLTPRGLQKASSVVREDKGVVLI